MTKEEIFEKLLEAHRDLGAQYAHTREMREEIEALRDGLRNARSFLLVRPDDPILAAMHTEIDNLIGPKP